MDLRYQDRETHCTLLIASGDNATHVIVLMKDESRWPTRRIKMKVPVELLVEAIKDHNETSR